MLDRYSTKAMKQVWTEQEKFNAWLKVEVLACSAWAELGVIPHEDVALIKENASFEIERIIEIEQETRHDVIAFTRAISESLGNEKKWVHYGLTSTDVVDTAYGCLYQQANDLIATNLDNFIQTLRTRALEFRATPMIGRTHGVHAEITSFGLKLALWYEEMLRNKARFNNSREYVEVGKISGAVGTHANTPPFVQDYVCGKLKINSANISTQVLQRDRHADYFATLALIASSIDKMATEIRHLQRTEVREVEEFFNKGQKGSSAMPHKRNPIASENLCGCSRIMRGYMVSAYENIPLWHERDISHSSAERILSQDATCLIDYMLVRFNKVITSLTVFEDNMLENINKTYGVIYSQQVLLSLVTTGMNREDAYDLVQPLAIKSWDNQMQFRELLEADPNITL
ncbi:MAG: adenylosuccinate lyase, partial [Spiroplasma sp.]|nr:adenylosuccinate lyase [Mycoplasmatales bacterium]